MFEAIKNLLIRAWSFLKKLYTKVVSFITNILGFFRAKYHEVLKRRPRVKAISLIIQDKLTSNDYNKVSLNNIVNTFYDEETEEIIKEETEVISYDALDEQTKAQFGNKDMIIIE